jgi:hypothetical protein
MAAECFVRGHGRSPWVEYLKVLKPPVLFLYPYHPFLWMPPNEMRRTPSRKQFRSPRLGTSTRGNLNPRMLDEPRAPRELTSLPVQLVCIRFNSSRLCCSSSRTHSRFAEYSPRLRRARRDRASLLASARHALLAGTEHPLFYSVRPSGSAQGKPAGCAFLTRRRRKQTPTDTLSRRTRRLLHRAIHVKLDFPTMARAVTGDGVLLLILDSAI